MMNYPKISLTELNKFIIEYFKDKDSEHCRFGQAFVNRFFDASHDKFPQLFYVNHYEIALSLIHEHCIDWAHYENY